MHTIIYKSKTIAKLIETAKLFAKTNSTVLITGESGVGKELFARLIHNESLRKDARFVDISCAGLPENLIEAEMFGYKKGAFTGAITDKLGKFRYAEGGTIFLDEISEMNKEVQSKLLRVLQEHIINPLGDENNYKVNIRVIAATNKNLLELLEKGLFREDLYYRINVGNIYIPSLRERIDDLPVLVSYFIKKFNNEFKKNINISLSGIKKFENYNWPGNIRELQHFIERLIVVSDTDQFLTEKDIELPDYTKTDIIERLKADELSFDEADRMFRQWFIKHNLLKNKGSITETARKLGLQRTYLSRLIKKYSIKKTDN